ncbi:hypothetical protein TVAG_076560 [Trichomonas vaginalis G3]|uniref:Uncharacterized protein n=1 Tax=Trichomonas vaginalis (strain ATCC PRA-98 / G3) TaxID=412133 RepID=A2D9Q3_TRIV3|nr:sperm-tail PG-rich repeat family [Trichomonas vaginalis G3]EAY22909.1 hypothetical protein TVAG_076560 [Trichomonas vaginalis G3]KAI5527365.1 sperm-tail PG-rich repeat family [Trichomonas vaginalis G3]|eukprot:XP_001583895.1 hypothetical protein [Trichomonas vaginalis G3]
MNEGQIDEYDKRPTTGHVGQKCIGFISDKNGNLIRLLPKEKDENMIGPGTYDPYKYESRTKRRTISRNSKRSSLILTDYMVGPADHFVFETGINVGHKIAEKHEPVIEAPKSGELAHESWTPKQARIPKNRFPQTKFSRPQSAIFASKTKREIFEQTQTTPDPGKYEANKVPKKRNVNDQTPIFKNRNERFTDSTSFTPAPGTYPLPEVFGNGPRFSLNPLSEFKPKDNQIEITPSPGQYEVEPVPQPQRPSMFRIPYRSVLGENIKRRKPEKERSPGICKYNLVDPPLNDTRPVSIQSKREIYENSWIPENITPGPATYDLKHTYTRITPTIQSVPHKKELEPDRYEDSNLAFSTLHGDFILKSKNKRYNKDLENWK